MGLMPAERQQVQNGTAPARLSSSARASDLMPSADARATSAAGVDGPVRKL
jgi:hypothetical protein